MWNPESTHMESGIQDSLGLPYIGQSFVEEEGYWDILPQLLQQCTCMYFGFFLQ